MILHLILAKRPRSNASGYEVSLENDENALELGSGNGCTTL